MAGVNVKMGVNGVAEFKRGMKDAQESVKTLNEALKLNESQMKLNGNAELYLQNKVALLNEKIQAQEQVVRQAQAALDAMAANGTDKASASYQKMQSAVYKASAELMDMKTDLKNVETGADKAGNEAEEMNNQLKGIGEGVSWENLTTGIDSFISKLESGARAAINMGKKIARSAMDSTKWADSIISDAAKYGVDVETMQRMQNAADFVEASVDTIMTARSKLYNGIGSGTQGTMDALGLLGITDTSDPAQVFWDAGEALMKMTDATKQEATAQDLFGKNWKELATLFTAGQEGYNEALKKTDVLTKEQVEALGKADDAFKSIQQEWERMKNSFWADNADKITNMMQWFIDNEGAVVAALTAIAGGFGALKLGSFALDLQKTIAGFQQLGLAKGAAGQAANGAVSGATGGDAGITKWISNIDIDTALGAGGLALIPTAYAWAIDRRRNHAEQVRGTDENFAANVGGYESLMRQWITANRQFDELEFTASEAEVAALQNKITEAYQKLSESEEGIKALQAYSDWRQERSLGNMDWEMPDYLSQAAEATSSLTEKLDGVEKSSADMTAAAKELALSMMELPGQIQNAVEAGMSGVTIQVDANVVDAMTPRIAKNLGDKVLQYVK